MAMELETAAKRLSELGHPVRLSVVRLLVQAGPGGLPVKDVRARVGIPQSTLSHHLAHLLAAGLISQTREGRVLRCRVEYLALQEVLTFLMQDCCAGLATPIQG